MSKSYPQENESDKRIMIEVGNLQRRQVNLEDRLSESQQRQNYASIESKSSQASDKCQKKSRHSACHCLKQAVRPIRGHVLAQSTDYEIKSHYRLPWQSDSRDAPGKLLTLLARQSDSRGLPVIRQQGGHSTTSQSMLANTTAFGEADVIAVMRPRFL